MRGILCVAALLLSTATLVPASPMASARQGSQAGPETGLSFDVASIAFHNERREAPVYELTVARGGPTLKETATPSEVQPVLVNRLSLGRAQLPARNATMM